MPPGNEDDERRDEGRAPITLRVDYKRLNTFFADYTRNISKGGTFIRTTKPLELGTEFVFVLTLPDPDASSSKTTELELTGQVKWVIPTDEATEESPAGMGIQFVFVDDSERRKVEEFVAQLMRASLGPHLTSKLLAR
jgi:type IV pilus assembly protein PilZ